jgi:L-ascorbate metabolism protein UlaG (beta-lactamase superfamily)
MTDGMRFRWLGAAGVELESGGERLLIDPYFSRVPFRYLFFGRPVPSKELILRPLSSARAIMVTHPHFDHLMDVPVVCREFHAAAYGSANTAALLLAHNVPSEKIHIVHPGDRFQDGPFSVEVFSGEHGRIVGMIPYTGPLPGGLKPPLKLRDYRMDCMLSFRVSAGGISVLMWNTPSTAHAPAADALVITITRNPLKWKHVIEKVTPSVVFPIHWDDFFSPVDRPLRPMMAPPRWGDRLFRRMNPQEFARASESFLPQGMVSIPQIFRSVELKPSQHYPIG